jgi:hypothetical protein
MAGRRMHLLVTVEDGALAKMSDVVARLKKSGLTNVKRMDTIGIVSGEAVPSRVAAIRKVSGVRAVEESARIQLPSPDAPIQ